MSLEISNILYKGFTEVKAENSPWVIKTILDNENTSVRIKED